VPGGGANRGGCCRCRSCGTNKRERPVSVFIPSARRWIGEALFPYNELAYSERPCRRPLAVTPCHFPIRRCLHLDASTLSSPGVWVDKRWVAAAAWRSQPSSRGGGGEREVHEICLSVCLSVCLSWQHITARNATQHTAPHGTAETLGSSLSPSHRPLTLRGATTDTCQALNSSGSTFRRSSSLCTLKFMQKVTRDRVQVARKTEVERRCYNVSFFTA